MRAFSRTGLLSQPTRRSSRRKTFIYAVCGDRQVERLNLSLKFLKKFSRSDIVVVASRITLPIGHDAVVRVPAEDNLNDHQVGLLLKTNVHRFVADRMISGCYLDTDVIATSEEVDSVFDAVPGPFAFAPDHVDLATFSSWAVACGCRSLRCHHLVEAIRKTFAVEVDATWRHWNGGLFVFSQEASPLLDCWHNFTRHIITDSSWQTRDQGTLIAAAWKLGLQNAPTLPRKFNFVVDCFHEMPLKDRPVARNEELPHDRSYSLRKTKNKSRPAFLHFINGGMLKRGWKNWDEVERLLGSTNGIRRNALSAKPFLEDNRVVHGLWIGKQLSRLELLTIHSFLKHGHEFHLWLYDDLETPLPGNVILENAEEILPRSSIFRRRDTDPETGVGQGSVATFADLFRYKLLYEKGGWWVDMDVTCLRPFDFSTEYVFRSHRVGVVNNIIKCPPRSMLMKTTWEQVERAVNEESPWLLPNRILFDNIVRLKLDRYVRPDICNQEDWRGAIKPLVEADCPLPQKWYAIHWINEMWRTLQVNGGTYQGRSYVDAVPDKDNVAEQSTLGRLYREHGLVSPSPLPQSSAPISAAPSLAAVAPILSPAKRQPVSPEIADDLHINILLPNLALGGAERSVVETLQGLAKRSPTAKLFLMHEADPAYGLKNIGRTKVFKLHHLDYQSKLRAIALEILASPTPVVFTHLVKARHLHQLWNWGVRTIPVVQNSRPSWQDEPSAFDNQHVPFVAAVSESVAHQLREAGCPKPVMVLRHEIQRWFSAEELHRYRREVRMRHAIPDDTLLIGMVGEFKSQKAYTRAVRVLAEVRRYHPAKLMILGGWDHAWGNGRAAYAAACRQALELDVMPDFLTPGPVREVEKYYAAFDVFLNTSIYEGLSVATLESIQAGCPIVSADAGGNREVLPQNAVIVHDSSDIAAYVSGIEKVLASGHRSVPVRTADSDLVPRAWCMIGQHGCAEDSPSQAACSIPLFLTDNLNLGGAARSLVNLLCRLPGSQRPWLCILNEVNHQSYLDELEQSGVHVFSLHIAGSYLDRVERILSMRRRLGADTLVFWNVDARVKLLLAKILPRQTARLVDVSPGPWLFEDLNNAAHIQRRIAMDYASYFDRIDHFVAKYADGTPPGLALPPGKVVVIPNGVPDLTAAPSRTPAIELPDGCNPELMIGTCCRILPSRRLDYFVDMMAEMNRRLPGVTMIVVGAANRRYQNYWNSIIQRAAAAGVSNIHFVGQQADVIPYLRLFRVFVILGTDHGCPNASLEALSLGIPVVTARHGGAVEQVQHGINGFLVSDEDPREMAHRVRTLLANPPMRERFGAASRRIAKQQFSMDLMVERYADLLQLRPGVQVRKSESRAQVILPTLAPDTTTKGDRPCVN